jgi:hypothetical protein
VAAALLLCRCCQQLLLLPLLLMLCRCCQQLLCQLLHIAQHCWLWRLLWRWGHQVLLLLLCGLAALPLPQLDLTASSAAQRQQQAAQQLPGSQQQSWQVCLS